MKILANKSIIDTIIKNAEENNNVHQPKGSYPTRMDNRNC